MCSRWLYDANFIVTNSDHNWWVGLYRAFYLPNTADAPYLEPGGFGAPFTNFPYGIPVQPNVLV